MTATTTTPPVPRPAPLITVEPGEEVILYPGSRSLPRVVTVTKVTPSGQIILEYDRYDRFCMDGKPLRRRTHDTSFIQKATAENRALMDQEIQRRRQVFYYEQLRNTVQICVQNMSIEELEQLLTQLGRPLPDQI
jgi:hypothetical protein